WTKILAPDSKGAPVDRKGEGVSTILRSADRQPGLPRRKLPHLDVCRDLRPADAEHVPFPREARPGKPPVRRNGPLPVSKFADHEPADFLAKSEVPDAHHAVQAY